MVVNCTFKLAYTCNAFSQNVNFNISPKEFKELIKDNVIHHMGASDFDIIVAGTVRSENNDPLDCSIDNVSLETLIVPHKNSCAFYIKMLENPDLDLDSIILGPDSETHALDSAIQSPDSIIQTIQHDCPVCYSVLIPIETITLGCNHQICRNCIFSWYRTGSISCPCCRA